jgi:hypothetical protein
MQKHGRISDDCNIKYCKYIYLVHCIKMYQNCVYHFHYKENTRSERRHQIIQSVRSICLVIAWGKVIAVSPSSAVGLIHSSCRGSARILSLEQSNGLQCWSWLPTAINLHAITSSTARCASSFYLTSLQHTRGTDDSVVTAAFDLVTWWCWVLTMHSSIQWGKTDRASNTVGEKVGYVTRDE